MIRVANVFSPGWLRPTDVTSRQTILPVCSKTEIVPISTRYAVRRVTAERRRMRRKTLLIANLSWRASAASYRLGTGIRCPSVFERHRLNVSSTTVRTGAARTWLWFWKPTLLNEEIADEFTSGTTYLVVTAMDEIINILESDANVFCDLWCSFALRTEHPTQRRGRGLRRISEALYGSGNALPGGSPGCRGRGHFQAALRVGLYDRMYAETRLKASIRFSRNALETRSSWQPRTSAIARLVRPFFIMLTRKLKACRLSFCCIVFVIGFSKIVED